MSKLLSAIVMSGVLALAGTALAGDNAAMNDMKDTTSFDRFDTNKDGKLSEAEARNINNLDFAKADTNGDGQIDRAEYQAARS